MKKRKAINFDLSTNELKKYFSDTREPYTKIKEFMLENNFEHRQYSGYASKEPMSNKQVTKLAERISEKFTWLSSCIQKFDVTDIGEQYDLTFVFEDKTLQKAPTKENLQKDSAKEQLRQQVKEIAQKLKNDKKDKNISKDKGIER